MTNQPENQQPGQEQHDRQPAGPIDMRKLADKVYRLMLADLRLERARGAPSRRRGEQ